MKILTRNHADLVLEVAKHIEADAVIQGEYWDGHKGCFIGCLTHSSDPKPAHERFGLPEPLLRIAENIFEALPNDEAKGFFAGLPKAVGRDGKDLSKIHWAFLASELRLLHQQDYINTVIAGMDLLAAREECPADAVYAADAADAADAAAYAADAAAYAARAYAYAAADAAYNAADAAAALRQRDTFLRLISEAE